MGYQSYSSTMSCEIRIIRAKNIDIKTQGEVFVRCYLSAGNNKRVQINTQHIPTKSDLLWNETFSLDCSGSDEDSISLLKQGSVIFELRWRSTAPFIGRINGSKLLGRAEIPWKNIFLSPNMEIENWVVMIPKDNKWVDEDAKPAAVQIGMKIQESAVASIKRRKNDRKWDECGRCMDGMCSSCVDYDIFAIGAAFEAL
ncbi:uncharacterized protein LOC111400260 [Olea europaea subsp. europaea]|uniref:Uncharacterized protein LOC111400260 n=1 Tax=Olea europaea subsp. europaea TaxID=158383 RepID=A0A8S0T3H2_OLEEU|nr:uncharacterized protein LOC111400260 [Olea europaea subsp. europaea]